jgi:hypothetical protein
MDLVLEPGDYTRAQLRYPSDTPVGLGSERVRDEATDLEVVLSFDSGQLKALRDHLNRIFGEASF